jgi:hypothetical protein
LYCPAEVKALTHHAASRHEEIEQGLHPVDRAAGTTTIFWTADAHDTELSRYPVEHLADAFAELMQQGATAWTGGCIDIDQHILARQMFGQCFVPRTFIGVAGCDFGRRLESLSLCKIGLDIFEAKCKLIVIKASGPASELRALKLLDDQLETLDLTVTALDDGCHVAHQAVQKAVSWLRTCCRTSSGSLLTGAKT